MKVWAFFKSPGGNLIMFVFLAAVGGWLIHRSNLREKAQAAQLTKVDDGDSHALRESILRDGQPLTVPAPVVRPPSESTSPTRTGEGVGAKPQKVRNLPAEKAAVKPRVLPITLFAGNA